MAFGTAPRLDALVERMLALADIPAGRGTDRDRGRGGDCGCGGDRGGDCGCGGDRGREDAPDDDGEPAASRRHVLGIAGAPGAGKSTLASELARGAASRGRRDEVAVLPMDGFHLADVALARLGRLDRKGAIDTFDGYGLLAMLRRVVDETEHTVYAPAFERELEQPIAGSIPIEPSARIVIVEGNYLLDEDEPWRSIRSLLSEVWFVETSDEVRLPRLIARHEQFGKSPVDARAWVERVDEANARRIAPGRDRADLVVRL